MTMMLLTAAFPGCGQSVLSSIVLGLGSRVSRCLGKSVLKKAADSCRLLLCWKLLGTPPGSTLNMFNF